MLFKIMQELNCDMKSGNEIYKGILVFWDEDHDERILTEIDRFDDEERNNIMAIQEHEGTLTVIFKYRKIFKEIETKDGDIWCICDYYVVYPEFDNKQRFCKHLQTEKKHISDEKTGEVKKIGIYCSDCGQWIKWEAFVEDNDFVMPFGKFKGSKITDIVKNESVYALWAVTNLSGGIKKRFERLMYGNKND